MEYLSRTYRLDEEVVRSIERAKAGGTSPNRFLRELLGLDGAEASKRLVARGDPVDLIPPRGGVRGTISVDEDERSATVHVDPATIPGVSRGLPAVGIRTMCEHCGEKFEAETRWEKRCGKCEAAGHDRSRYDCAECRLNA